MQQAYPKNEAKERTKKCDEQQFSELLEGGAPERDAPGVIACSYRCLGETCFCMGARGGLSRWVCVTLAWKNSLLRGTDYLVWAETSSWSFDLFGLFSSRTRIADEKIAFNNVQIEN